MSIIDIKTARINVSRKECIYLTQRQDRETQNVVSSPDSSTTTLLFGPRGILNLFGNKEAI